MKRSPAPGAPLSVRCGATLFLIGEAAPFAPATFGSAATLPVVAATMLLPVWLQVMVLAVVTGYAVLVSGRAERWYGHDAKAIVIDEVAGMLVTFLAVVPASGPGGWALALGAGFVLFRILDVVKPFPAGRAQDLPGGRGVVSDDLIAGLYANLLLRVVLALAGG